MDLLVHQCRLVVSDLVFAGFLIPPKVLNYDNLLVTQALSPTLSFSPSLIETLSSLSHSGLTALPFALPLDTIPASMDRI